MNFPAYVPAAVQQYIATLLHGDGRSLEGWTAAAKHPDFEWLVPAVVFLRRFEEKDERIEEMFSYLEKANLSDADKKRFVNAAWAALTDYGKYRDALKRANKQRQDIAEKAEELAQLLRDISGNGLFDTPMEFYDVRTLLRETNGNDLTWPYNRRYLLGELNESTSNKVAPEDVTVIVDRRVKKTISEVTKPGPVSRLRDDIAYAWRISPSLSELLDTVAKAARNYEPQFHGRIGAAISKGQRSPRTEFIRALGDTLIEAGIPLTEGSVSPEMAAKAPPRRKSAPAQTVAYSIRKAIAAAATVALQKEVSERDIAQQFPGQKPITRPPKNARVIRFD